MIFNGNIPIYVQIMDDIKEKILLKTLKPNERISSVRSLADEYNVNQNTIQRVCTELEREGIIYTQRGVGSFVTQSNTIIDKLKEKKKKQMMQTFLSGMKGIGFNKKEIIKLIEEGFDE